MTILSKDIVQILLISLLLVIIPMFYFPARFGLDLATGSFTYSLIEIVFYGLIFYLIRPGATLIQLLQGAGLTFLYRIFVSTVFGFCIWLLYGMEFSVALTLGVSRYMPSIILHIIAAPFVMRGLYISIVGDRRRSRSYRTSRKIEPAQKRPAPRTPYLPKSVSDTRADGGAGISDSNVQISPEANGYERAVRYIGEHHAVVLSAVVDWEGLMLAHFARGDVDPEKWAPLPRMMAEENEKIIGRNSSNNRPTGFDITFGPSRLIVRQIDDFSLMVLSNHEEDELLNIRIKQGAEMIRKYVSERYGTLMPEATEEQYVSNT